MTIYRFRVHTTKATIETAATTHEAAIRMVMAFEGCPASAIRKCVRMGRAA